MPEERTLRRVRGLPLWLSLALCCGLLAGCRSTAPPLDGEPGRHREALRSSGGTNLPRHANAPHVVLVSFDGFRPDYLDRFDLPNFRRAMASGTRAVMTPVFPSLTFPNHFSLVTGLHAERHGIIANEFYDPDRGETYSLRLRATVTDGSWYDGEPLWVTAERQGMVAACYFWPGSEAAIGGTRPTIAVPYDTATPNAERVRTVLEWLALPAERRPHVITLYFSEVDAASHRFGLDAPEIQQAAQSLDRSLGALLDGIDALPIRDSVFLVLTSDHGMVDTSDAQALRIETMLDLQGMTIGFVGPVASLHTGGDRLRARLARDRLNAQLRHGRAYLRDELPERFRFRTSRRAGDVVVVMDEGWTLQGPSSAHRAGRWGMHGWDPALPSMKALFLVAGPGIRQGATAGPVENVDVYPFLTEILGLQAAPGIDGRAGAIRRLVSAAAAGTRDRPF